MAVFPHDTRSNASGQPGGHVAFRVVPGKFQDRGVPADDGVLLYPGREKQFHRIWERPSWTVTRPRRQFANGKRQMAGLECRSSCCLPTLWKLKDRMARKPAVPPSPPPLGNPATPAGFPLSHCSDCDYSLTD